MSSRGEQSHYYPGAVQIVSVATASAAITNPVGAQTMVVRIVSTTACHYRFAKVPVAVTTDSLLPANVVEYLSIKPGEKVAFIRISGDGTASVTEMTQ